MSIHAELDVSFLWFHLLSLTQLGTTLADQAILTVVWFLLRVEDGLVGTPLHTVLPVFKPQSPLVQPVR